MSLFARNRAGTLTFTVRNEDGTPTAPTGSVAVTVRDVAGTSIATGTATAGSGTGVFTYALPSDVRSNLGRYEVTLAYTLSGVSESVVVPVAHAA